MRLKSAKQDTRDPRYRKYKRFKNTKKRARFSVLLPASSATRENLERMRSEALIPPSFAGRLILRQPLSCMSLATRKIG